VLAAAGHHSHDLGHEDLAPARKRAQARRLDHRRSVVVALEQSDLAHAEPHPDRQRLLRIAVPAVERLLHPRRGVECRGRAREREHQAVAEVLHLAAAGCFDPAAEDLEELDLNVVSRGGSDAGCERGRVDQIGEQDADDLD
jgi:hypothetical protein